MGIHLCPNCGCNLGNFEPFNLGNVAIDPAGVIRFEGQPVRLSRSVHEIVEGLLRAKGRGITRSALANRLIGGIDDMTVKKYIERARRSFRSLDPAFDQIEALHGFGAYRWSVRAPATSH